MIVCKNISLKKYIFLKDKNLSIPKKDKKIKNYLNTIYEKIKVNNLTSYKLNPNRVSFKKISFII